MEKVIAEELCPYLSQDSPKELQPLLEAPFMTRKVAAVLFDRGITSLESFVEQDPHDVVKHLKLAVDFTLQVPRQCIQQCAGHLTSLVRYRTSGHGWL